MSEKVCNLRERPSPGALAALGAASLVLIALALVGVFAVAIVLDPYQDGKVWLAETHRQLGLPACTFKTCHGLSMPLVRHDQQLCTGDSGDLWHSVQANFVGTALALLGLAFIPWAGLVRSGAGSWAYETSRAFWSAAWSVS